MLITPTVSSATALLGKCGESASSSSMTVDLVLGLGVLLAAVFVQALLVMLFATNRFGARCMRQRIVVRGDNLLQQRLRWLYRSAVRYEDAADRPGFVERWDFVFGDYATGRQWFVAVDHFMALCAGVLSGLTAMGPGWCRALSGVLSAASVAFVALLLCLQPHATRADRYLAVCGAAMQSGAAVLGLAGRDTVEAFVVLQSIATAVYLAGLAAWAVAGQGHAVRCVRLLLRRHRDRAAAAPLRRRQHRVAVLSSEALSALLDETVMASLGDRGERDRYWALRRLVDVICSS
jgi:hypothetical protein